MKLFFRPMAEADWPDVRRIYEEGIATGHGTFEAAPPDSWAAFIESRRADGCIVARREDGRMAAWGVLMPVSKRLAYAGVAEVGLYVAGECRGSGVGSAVLAELIAISERLGIWTLQGVTFPENAASVALQQKFGFRLVGRRERIARMPRGPLAGQWRDTVLLERRSPIVGRD